MVGIFANTSNPFQHPAGERSKRRWKWEEGGACFPSAPFGRLEENAVRGLILTWHDPAWWWDMARQRVSLVNTLNPT